MKGANQGSSWHGAKIAECGALCSSNPTSGVVLVEFDEIGFTVEAMSENAFCTPETVAAHMLYENADPFVLLEPGGYMDVTNAFYTPINSFSSNLTVPKGFLFPLSPSSKTGVT